MTLSLSGSVITAELEDDAGNVYSATVPGAAVLTQTMTNAVIAALHLDVSEADDEIDLIIGSGFTGTSNGAFYN